MDEKPSERSVDFVVPPRFRCEAHGPQPGGDYLRDSTGKKVIYYCLRCYSEWLAKTFKPMKEML